MGLGLFTGQLPGAVVASTTDSTVSDRMKYRTEARLGLTGRPEFRFVCGNHAPETMALASRRLPDWRSSCCLRWSHSRALLGRASRRRAVCDAVGKSPLMFETFPSPPLVGFRLAMKPSAVEVGRICATGKRAEAVFLFSFGELTASHRVDDAWTGCCELYLQAQMAEQSDLRSFRLGGEELFTVGHVADAVICSWSRHHIFAVQKEQFVRSFESLIEQVLAVVSAGRRDDFVHLGATLIRNEPNFGRLKRSTQVAC